MKEDKTRAIIQLLKESLEKDQGREVTWEEAEKAQSDLQSLAHIVYDSYQKDHQLKLQLKKNPKVNIFKPKFVISLKVGSGSFFL